MAQMDRSEVVAPGGEDQSFGSTATEAFATLSSEVRLTILLVLWETYDPFPDGTSDPSAGSELSFSELRERVGMRDSGQFNYHLDRLEGHFVQRTPDGYTLLPAGQMIARAVVASAGFAETTREPDAIDLPCPNCGGATAITYQNQRIYLVCTECEGNFALDDQHPGGVLGGWISTPGSMRGRTAEEIYIAKKTEHLHHTALQAANVCPECSGPGELTLHVCEDHAPRSDEPCAECGRHFDPAIRFVCTVCKYAGLGAVFNYVWHHPAVIAFLYDHGLAFGYPYLTLETARLADELKEHAEQEIVSTDPPRVRITITYEGDELTLTFDETLTVVDVAGFE